jgi:DNA segregation ATPase FtsK/SpoIIIE-like protein
MLEPPLNFEEELDELLKQAAEVVIQYDRASASLLQRRLSIGYAKAARLLEQLEEAGVVGPPEGSKHREVLIRSSEKLSLKVKTSPHTQQEDTIEVPENYKVPTHVKLSKEDKTPWGKQISDVIKSKGFKRVKIPCPVLLGFDDKDNLRATSLSDVGHLIISGNPQRAKENWLDTILTTLLLKHTPKEIRFVLIDANHYFELYNGTPHLLAPVITVFDKSVSAFRWTIYEVDRRLKLFVQAGVRNFNSYNELPNVDRLPRILIINRCDFTSIETTDAMTFLSSTGLRAGVNLFIVTNRLGNNNLDPDIKANIPTRAVFGVTSSQDSRLAGVNGAESLKEGEMIFKAGNKDQQKLTTVYTPETNVKEVVEVVTKSQSR